MENTVMPPSKRLKVTMSSYDFEDELIAAELAKADKCMDWRDDEEKYRLRHKHALENGILTDVKFIVGPEKTPFEAHKIFLALASPVFEVMFFGSLKETNEIIHIPDITPMGFKALLDFVYNEDINFSNEVDAFSTWLAAEKYCMPFMKDECFKYLTTYNLNNGNVWGILENALFFNSQPIVDKCKEYLKENISMAAYSKTFLESSKEVIEYLVMLDLLNIDEIELFSSIVRWGKEKVKNGARESLEQILQPFMKYVRFGCMNQKELVSFIAKNKNIIADKDVVELLKYMTDSAAYSLPDWCSANVFPRKTNEVYDRPLCKNIRSYALSPKYSQHENNFLPHDYHETQNSPHCSRSSVSRQRHNSDSDDSITEFLVLPFQDTRPVNASSPTSSPISSISSFSDTSSDTSSASDSN